MSNQTWKAIFDTYKISEHNFDKEPFLISADQIKSVAKNFNSVSEREVRILCKQDTRNDRPALFVTNNLFILPVQNGKYAIIKGEGYVDIPPVDNQKILYSSKLDFQLDTSLVGSSEMQHLDFAYASSLIRTFAQDASLVLTIRGRKYTPPFSFRVGNQTILTKGVQTEVDAGYEGKNQVVLVEAKNSQTNNVIIRQLYYPFCQWQAHTQKPVKTFFFEKRDNVYCIWQFAFDDVNDYNSIKLEKSQCFEITVSPA